MSCCGPATRLDEFSGISPEEVLLASRDLGNGLRQTVLSVPRMHCAACIRAVERSLLRTEGVKSARANLSQRRVTVNWTQADVVPDLVEALRTAGYEANIPGELTNENDETQAHLLRALAVAGFCSMNIMLFAVSVWAGADAPTRHAFQLFSAALAVPAVVYSGSSFYASAWRALSKGRLNMDVPISAGVLLSFALSLYDAFTNSAQAYFEAATSLLFVLLAGRLLDHVMRRKARSAANSLARMMPHGADVVSKDGSIHHVLIGGVRPGDRILVPMGARVPTDGVILKGSSELNASMLTGESAHRAVHVGDRVRAGEINRGRPFEFRAEVSASDSLLSEMSRLLAAAEDGRTRYRRMADRAASLYAPIVHSLSALAFISWLFWSGDLHRALTVAVAVLVITCPCALGLAVPMVQVTLARRLYDKGVLAIDGTAFERLAGVDTVVFDKTGTLTTGEPTLVDVEFRAEDLAVAGALASRSNHPFARALVAARDRAQLRDFEFDKVEELPGYGMEGRKGDQVYRLGKPNWAAGSRTSGEDALVLACDGVVRASFCFAETLRPGAAQLVKALEQDGIRVCLLSGDSRMAVERVASELRLPDHRSEFLPADKVDFVRQLKASGRTVLMVGDGVNDAAALRVADVSIAPSSASDVGRSAADFVFLSRSLSVIHDGIVAARLAMRLVRQNFALAAIYNLASLPLAFAGYVTPLMAAVAMSTSSILVVVNSLRLALPVEVDRDAVRVAPNEGSLA